MLPVKGVELKQFSARVISNRMILPGIRRPGVRPEPRPVAGSYLIWLKCPEITREAQPGQFVLAYCGDDCTLPRPFSIHGTNGDDIALFFTVWGDGKGTLWLSQRPAGDAVKLLGPLGHGYTVYPAANNLLLVAGGIGIAPLCFLAEENRKRGHEITLLMGARRADQP